MKKIIKILCSITISIILSLALYFGLNTNSLLVKFYGISILTVGSGSMLPELSVGDVIIIKACDDYKINDIITYNVNNEYLVTHRIIEKDGNTFVTKGDNNNIQDREIVLKENIEGKVIYNSQILKFIYEYWLILIIAILFILIII
ncbi:MAG: signal peptidase I [Clostridia bacterium]|nr:signal peptidase I [Clostridia bacterium]